MISKLKKLKGRSLAELADRGRQGADAFFERTRMSKRKREISDGELLRSFGIEDLTINGLPEYLRARKGAVFYPSFRNRDETIAALERRFPRERGRVIEKADKITAGEFDLLGFESLKFGGALPDWHLEPISGKRSPLKHWSLFLETDAVETGDKKIVWELNRHQYFTTLGAAYWLTGDEKYAETFVSHVTDWIEKNLPGMGINWVSSLEISFRSISWIWATSFFINSPSLSGTILSSMLKCLVTSGRHIYRHLSTYASPNTHLTGEALGLYALGCFLPEVNEARAWKKKGYEILISELSRQVREDGGHVEQSIHYHRYTADFYLTLLVLIQAEGLTPDDLLVEKVGKMLDVLVHAAHPDGTTPMLGDEDGGRLIFLDGRPINDLRSTIAVGAVLLDDGLLKFAAGEPTPELLWLTGPAGLDKFEKLESIAPDEDSKCFEETGLYSMRTDWGQSATHLIVDCGEHGFLNGAHAHADALNVVLFSGGLPVLVDSGTGSYTGDADVRDRLRSSAAHNCLLVNGESSSVAAGPFAWNSMAQCELINWHVDEDQCLFRGRHDGFERFNVSYEREVHLDRAGVVSIIDEVSSAAENTFDVIFILDPRIIAIPEGPMRLQLNYSEGNRSLLIIETVLEGDVQCPGWEVGDTTISPQYGKFTKTKRLKLKFSGAGMLRATNVFRLGSIGS